MTKEEVLKAHCNSCGRETRHFLVARHDTSDVEYIEKYGEVRWWDTYELLECLGCSAVVLKHTNNFSELLGPTIRYYPPRVSRALPKWRRKLPQELGKLLDQVYTALHADSRWLALMGARTVVDLLMADKIGDVGTFQAKLAELEKHGYVGRKNREFLSTALDAGSAAAHRGFVPAADDLNHIFDIIENVLEAVYVLEKAARTVEKTTPKRTKPRNSSSA